MVVRIFSGVRSGYTSREFLSLTRSPRRMNLRLSGRTRISAWLLYISAAIVDCGNLYTREFPTAMTIVCLLFHGARRVFSIPLPWVYGARLLERAGISDVRVYVVGICWRWCKRVGITCVVCKSLGYKRCVYILRLYTRGYKRCVYILRLYTRGYKSVGYEVAGV